MASGDNLRNLFRFYSRRDDVGFRTAAEAIVEEERLKNHRLLADDLERLLRNGNSKTAQRGKLSRLAEVPKDRERGFPLLTISEGQVLRGSSPESSVKVLQARIRRQSAA